MSVHLQIGEQINNHILAQKQYKELDSMREFAIEVAITKAKNKQEFDTGEINVLTEKINEVAKRYNFPLRKIVTKEMVLQYISN